MNDKQTAAIDNINQKIAKLVRLSAAIESLPDFDTRQLYDSCEEICATIPYDLAKIREVRAALGSDWEVRDNPYVMESGSWVVRYQKVNDPTICLVLFADAYGDGATCKRVKVGVKELPIYKIVCGEELVEA
jgi:hypothetical protein